MASSSDDDCIGFTRGVVAGLKADAERETLNSLMEQQAVATAVVKVRTAEAAKTEVSTDIADDFDDPLMNPLRFEGWQQRNEARRAAFEAELARKQALSASS